MRLCYVWSLGVYGIFIGIRGRGFFCRRTLVVLLCEISRSFIWNRFDSFMFYLGFHRYYVLARMYICKFRSTRIRFYPKTFSNLNL